MIIEDARLVDIIGRFFDRSVHVAVANAPLPFCALNRAERNRAAGFPYRRRQREWLTGRAALKKALTAAGLDSDTAALRFPHPFVSLSHAGNRAIAVAIVENESTGIGIDYERCRRPNPKMPDLFLFEKERECLTGLDPDAWSRRVVQLWTAKEAVFKASPGNGNATLADIVLATPSATTGRAYWRDGGEMIMWDYHSFEWGDGIVSVARPSWDRGTFTSPSWPFSRKIWGDEHGN